MATGAAISLCLLLLLIPELTGALENESPVLHAGASLQFNLEKINSIDNSSRSFCKKIVVFGRSRILDPGKFPYDVNLQLIQPSPYTEDFDVCLVRDSSLELCGCLDHQWIPVSQSHWSMIVSPFDSFLIHIQSRNSSSFKLSASEELNGDDVLRLIFGFALILFSGEVSSYVRRYFRTRELQPAVVEDSADENSFMSEDREPDEEASDTEPAECLICSLVDRINAQDYQDLKLENEAGGSSLNLDLRDSEAQKPESIKNGSHDPMSESEPAMENKSSKVNPESIVKNKSREVNPESTVENKSSELKPESGNESSEQTPQEISEVIKAESILGNDSSEQEPQLVVENVNELESILENGSNDEKPDSIVENGINEVKPVENESREQKPKEIILGNECSEQKPQLVVENEPESILGNGSNDQKPDSITENEINEVNNKPEQASVGPYRPKRREALTMENEFDALVSSYKKAYLDAKTFLRQSNSFARYYMMNPANLNNLEEARKKKAKSVKADQDRGTLAAQIFAIRNPETRRRLDQIDLHGLMVRDAMSEFKRFYREAMAQNMKRIRVVTGRGVHSDKNLPRIREAMEAYCTRKQIEWEYLSETDLGCLVMLVKLNIQLTPEQKLVYLIDPFVK